ncbi:MAG: hypothetical protein GY811_21960, partial [Myxococcales bacterium]|nr:hypothetical protein [Myxococcales bacterium]
MRTRCFIGLAGLALACNASNADVTPPKAPAALAPVPTHRLALPKPWSDEALDFEAERYLSDAAFRRSILEASLTSKKNIYARTRMSGYGLEGRGWEMLPEWTPRTKRIDDAYVSGLAEGQPLSMGESAKPLWDGTR